MVQLLEEQLLFPERPLDQGFLGPLSVTSSPMSVIPEILSRASKFRVLVQATVLSSPVAVMVKSSTRCEISFPLSGG